MLDNKISANQPVSRNSTYGRVYLKKNKEEYSNQGTDDKLKNRKVYSKNKSSYGSKGAYSIER